MPRQLFRACYAAVLAWALSSPAPVAAQRAAIRFKVVNATPDEIVAVYACPTGAAQWGPNLLTRGPLAPGQRRVLAIAGECGLYDLRLVAPGGKEYMDEELTFCEDDDVVTIGAGELKKAKTRPEGGQ